MDQVPTTIYNDHKHTPTLYNVQLPRPPNSQKPPTHPTPNTYPSQQSNPWRQISSISTTSLYPSRPPPLSPRPDTSSFVIVMYTTLAVTPDSSPPQVEAARTLHSMGYPTSNPPITHVSALSGAGTITVSAVPPTPSPSTRPPYVADNFCRDPSRQDKLFSENYTDRPQIPYQPDTLPRPHDYPIPTHPLPAHDSHLQQTHSLPPQPAPLDTRHQSYPPDYDRQIHPQQPLPDNTALSRQPRMNGPIIFRTDPSIPATPTTPATSATQQFSAAPSSPENNGASSNGSGTTKHTCTFPGCSKTFDRRYNLTVHYRRHTNEMPYPCKFPGCPQKFKWRSSQSHHMKTRHQMSSAGRASRNNNAMRQIGNTTGVSGYAAGGSTVPVMTGSSMPPTHTPIMGLATDDEPTGTYKRAFSPRKRQKRETHTS